MISFYYSAQALAVTVTKITKLLITSLGTESQKYTEIGAINSQNGVKKNLELDFG